MNSLEQGRLGRHRSRLWMALVILLAAGAVAFWGAGRETRRMTEIERVIGGLCRDVAAGRDVSARLKQMTPVDNPRLAQALQRACASQQGDAELQVDVVRGDYRDTGHFAGSATHTAMIRRGAVQLLGLRIKYNDPGKPITILGYWVPQSR
jgi:hypothetical protein